jgi:FlaA1/EpsC-like NDP-sugar epimerase
MSPADTNTEDPSCGQLAHMKEECVESTPRLLLNYRKLIILSSQAILVATAYYLAVAITFDFEFSITPRTLFFSTVLPVVAVKLVVFWMFGLLQGWWRYVGMSDLFDITKSAATSTAVIAALAIGFSTPIRRPILILDFILTILIVGGARFAVRAYTEHSHMTYSIGQRSLIVGAGSAGADIVRELRHSPDLKYIPVGFVDRDLSKVGLKINGVKVLGTIEKLQNVVARHRIETVIITNGSARDSVAEQVITKCRQCKVAFKILPDLSERLNGSESSLSRVRDVRLEDLLGRTPVRLELDNIRKKLEGKVVLVTGAGGSIGAELVRQLVTFSPRNIVLFERSENDLFKITMELAEKFPFTTCTPVIGDILDVSVLRDVFATYRPDSVFHAAAYKHVPMMEVNCFQAIANNVFGTYNVALVARQYGARDFVLISSDKAVNPTNVMGVTKRVAELLILSLQETKTRFTAVRFGNVLGSNGSVVPIFQRQISAGGPLTITHPEAKRYFMTIPEAVQLVLQASTMGKGGEIFILEMSEPMLILDLARNLIRLSGHVPEQEIKIVFTGLRPGEKLFEELQLDAESLKPTSHEKIRVLDGGSGNFAQVKQWLEELSGLLETKNIYGLIEKLQAIVPEYQPSDVMIAQAEMYRHDLSSKYQRDRRQLAIVEPLDPSKDRGRPGPFAAAAS